MIPEPQHAVAHRFQVFRSLQVILNLIQMLAAVQLNNYFPSRRTKVNNVVADGLSPAPTHRGRCGGEIELPPCDVRADVTRALLLPPSDVDAAHLRGASFLVWWFLVA